MIALLGLQISLGLSNSKVFGKKSSCQFAIYHIENLFVNSKQIAIATTNVAQSNQMDMTSCTAMTYFNQMTIRDWKDSWENIS